MSKLTRSGFHALHTQAAELMEQSRGRLNVLVCAGTGCIASGAMKVYDYLRTTCQSRGIPVAVCLKDEAGKEGIHLKKSGCHGFCEIGPLVCIEPLDILYAHVKVEDCDEIIEKTILGGEVIERLLYTQNGVSYQRRDDIPFYKNQHRVVLKNSGKSDAEDMTEYLALGGYTAFEKALFTMTGEEICREIANSGLRGRGGGGFPAGRKWESVRRHTEEPVKYIVCNGDEGDPGAFMDRSVLEDNPLSVIEGMTIAGYAIGASEGYFYVRAEYPTAVKHLRNAIKMAEEEGLLGDNILGSGFNFRAHIRLGAGAFVCGEETALLNSIQGQRGMPRPRPPFPAVKGLWDCPTIVNNVETLATVPYIMREGVEEFTKYGTAGSKGTKVFALGGKVNNVGLVEVPMGTTLRELVFDIGGGIPNGKRFKAIQTGGPSGGCIVEDELDASIDFDNLVSLGSMMGSGGAIVMDEDNCMVDVAKFYMEFIRDESCGKCSPCRIGTKRMLEILTKICEGGATMKDFEELEEISVACQNNSLCSLGQSAANPVISTISNFYHEYMEHINDKKCRAKVCKNLMDYYIDPDKCRKCSLCAKKCPVDAISGEVGKVAFTIDPKVCIRCGMCMASCKFGAIFKE